MRAFAHSVVAGLVIAGLGAAGAVPSEAAPAKHDYLVFYADGWRDEAFDAIRAAGGKPEDHPTLRYAVVRGVPASFPEAADTTPAVVGVARDLSIGAVDGHGVPGPATKGEPLTRRQWDMKMIGAPAKGAFGTHKVLVGIMDTGVDATHPDIAPNFNHALSRSFVRDRRADVDVDSHGTHVAGIIGAASNGIGITGVAPGVSLVSLRVTTNGQAFHLKATMDALTYAADVGIDVVNMSYILDTWLFNCPNREGDSWAEQLEQAGVIVGVQRAVDYARAHGVTVIASLGNYSTDLDTPTVDDGTSPGHPRKVDATCLSMPAMAKGVIAVSALTAGAKLASYSNYGVTYTDVSAPGGDGLDIRGDPYHVGAVLSAVPEKALRDFEKIDARGRIKDQGIVRQCEGRRCAYYEYLVGTSMAAPHVTGVAAILISRFGRPGKGGLTMDPAEVERLLYASAVCKACPPADSFARTCQGGKADNGFYGRGIINAGRAAAIGRSSSRG